MRTAPEAVPWFVLEQEQQQGGVIWELVELRVVRVLAQQQVVWVLVLLRVV